MYNGKETAEEGGGGVGDDEHVVRCYDLKALVIGSLELELSRWSSGRTSSFQCRTRPSIGRAPSRHLLMHQH